MHMARRLHVFVVLHDNCVYNHPAAFLSPGLYGRVRGLRAPDRQDDASKGRLARDQNAHAWEAN